MKRCFLVVIDSLGVGEAPDAKQYGDEGVNTLGNVAKHVQGVDLPTFDKLGFGKITNVLGLGTEHNATVGRLSEVSIGNDSTTGHWEIAGLVTTQEFKTFPDGFPHELINKIENEIDYKISLITLAQILLSPPYIFTRERSAKDFVFLITI
mgnify:CR=1 FL=1